MLNALSISLRGANPDGSARAEQSMRRQGFHLAQSFAWDNGSLLGFAHPTQADVADLALRESDRVAFCVGPLWYRGRFGNVALKLLVEGCDGREFVDESELRGNFAVFIRTTRQCLLLNDLLGFVRIYASTDGLFYSTSWLAACAYAGNTELDETALVEYVLLGASHSDQTLARDITTLPLASAFDLTQRKVRARTRPWANANDVLPATPDTAVTQISSHLHKVFAEAVDAFPTRTRMALSGGFDSRLILAGLLAAGAHPGLFVYGGKACEDVCVACMVADSIGASLDIVDKNALNGARPAPDLESLISNTLFFDGLPNDGIYDPGADAQTRLIQTAGGYLVMNGGGGEIFRNYFHLSKQRLSAMDIVRSFYRGFDHRVFRRRRDLADYEHRLASAILRAVAQGTVDVRQPLEREWMELAYPLFRCHHWMAVNNSITIRHGYFTTPLIDPSSIHLAWRLPLAWKNAGWLESRLVTTMHHGVASQPSAYGFRFSDGPNAKARIGEWRDRSRPIFARPLIGALGRRLRGESVSTALFARCRDLLPGEWRTDPVLDLRFMPDDQAFGRALAVEVVCRQLFP